MEQLPAQHMNKQRIKLESVSFVPNQTKQAFQG